MDDVSILNRKLDPCSTRGLREAAAAVVMPVEAASGCARKPEIWACLLLLVTAAVSQWVVAQRARSFERR